MLDAKEEKERERRRKRYKFALVKWDEDLGYVWEKKPPDYAVEHKDVLAQWWAGSHTVICDDQPEKALRGMLKLLKEDK